MEESREGASEREHLDVDTPDAPARVGDADATFELDGSPDVAPYTLDALARLPDDAIDVALAAALIARDAYGRLDVRACLARLDGLAAPLVLKRPGLGAEPPSTQARALAEYFAGELGFRGNEGAYYDLRNSFLPDVLERRVGIPITLSLVYCEIARRAGVKARGVGFPGHYIVRIDAADAAVGVDPIPVFVDPFHGGRTLHTQELESRLTRALGKGAPASTSHPSASAAPSPAPSIALHVKPAGPRATIVRMLTNIKGIHGARGDFARAYLALSRILAFAPDSAGALRERAAVAVRLGSLESARTDYARSLDVDPTSDDAKKARARLAELDATPRASRPLN